MVDTVTALAATIQDLQKQQLEDREAARVVAEAQRARLDQQDAARARAEAGREERLQKVLTDLGRQAGGGGVGNLAGNLPVGPPNPEPEPNPELEPVPAVPAHAVPGLPATPGAVDPGGGGGGAPVSRREQVAAAGRQVTLLLARLKEAEGLRAELCGEDARVVKIQDADEIAAEAPVEDAPFSSAEPPVASIGALPASDRFVFYQEQPYERDAQTYRTQDRGIEPPFVLPSNLTIKKKDLIPSFGALASVSEKSC